MAVDYFLKIDGIAGESTDDKHKGEIDVESWSWGAVNSSTTHAGGGAGAGKVTVSDFQFVTRTSKASPMLFLSCANGKHIPSAKLTSRKAGGKEQQEFLTITFEDVIVTSYQDGGSSAADVAPTDQVGLNFARIRVTYQPFNADGSKGVPVEAGWDIPNNKAL